jgi:hypothetical protein
MRTAIDGFTGQTAVSSGRKAQQKIRGLANDRDAEMKEVEAFGK